MALIKSGNRQEGLELLKKKGYFRGSIDSFTYSFMAERPEMLDKVDNLPYDTQKAIIDKGFQEDKNDSLVEFIQIINQFINSNYSNRF